jgi:hypothetical protein
MPVVFTTSLSVENIQPASAVFLLQELPVKISISPAIPEVDLRLTA